VNAGGHGFYRVSYAPELLASLRGRVGDLAPIERALLVEDTWASVLAGTASATSLLELASGFAERDRPDGVGGPVRRAGGDRPDPRGRAP
jgi:hypothetical protein